jgi:hypothetical protein
MGLRHALLDDAFDLIQLSSGQGTLESAETLDGLNRLDGFPSHRTESSR